MQSVARPVYTYLESLYAGGDDGTDDEREAAKSVEQASTRTLFHERASAFKPPAGRRKSDEVSVQFKAKRKQIAAVQEHLEQPRMSAGDIGRYAFKYFLENEEIV